MTWTNIVNRTTNVLHPLFTRSDYLVRFGYELLDPGPNCLGINLRSQTVINTIAIMLESSNETYIFYYNVP